MTNSLRKILITQSQIRNYSGSEVTTLELTEYFSKMGAEITILTHYADDPIKQNFLQLGAKIIITSSTGANNLKLKDYDLMWVHHHTLNTTLISQLVHSKHKPRVVFHHMSMYDPMEFPIMYRAESNLADIVLFNSEETKIVINSKGAKFDSNKSMVFGNPSPDRFYIDAKTHKPNTQFLKRIVVISNHVPEELNAVYALLKKSSIQVDFIGRNKLGAPTRVTAEVLDKYDVVISIGKTVQYCIVRGIPVYCYDHFGGSGYLNPENFSENRFHNFSGRGFGKKSPEIIHNEITKGFDQARDDTVEIHKRYATDFLLSTAIRNVQQSLEVTKPKSSNLIDIDRSAYESFINLNQKILPTYYKNNYEIKEVKEAYPKLKHQYNELHKEFNKLQKEITDLKDSKLYKIEERMKRWLDTFTKR